MNQAKQRIVFLDADTVDFGDVSFREIEKLGPLKLFPHTQYSQIPGRLKKVPIVITNKCRFDRKLLSRLPDLKSIHVAATGVNNIDLEAAHEAGIAVTNVRNYCTEMIVQSTFAFILALADDLLRLNKASHNGTWSRSRIFMHRPANPPREVNGKTLGIIGYGHIGKRIAQVAKALGMNVVISQIPGKTYSSQEKRRRVSFQQVIHKSDFITIHAPLNALTQNLINGRTLSKMKKSVFLINTARGGIVDERALRRALETGRIAGAACDVLTQEPPPRNHVLLNAPNLLLTPHAVWASLEARTRLLHEVALNIDAFQEGRRRNRLV